MPVYSIAYGVIAGVGSYILLNFIPFIIRKLTNERFTPPLYDLGEKWKVPPGGFIPLWMSVSKYFLWLDVPR